jgi:hypothetical protein
VENNEIKDVFDFEGKTIFRDPDIVASDRLAVIRFVWKKKIERSIFIGEEKLFIPYRTNPLTSIYFKYNRLTPEQNKEMEESLLLVNAQVVADSYRAEGKKIWDDRLTVEAVERFIQRRRSMDLLKMVSDAPAVWNPNWFQEPIISDKLIAAQKEFNRRNSLTAMRVYLDRQAMIRFISKRIKGSILGIHPNVRNRLNRPYELKPHIFRDNGKVLTTSDPDFKEYYLSHRPFTPQHWAEGLLLGSEALLSKEQKEENKIRTKIFEEHKARGWWKNLCLAFIGRV